MQKLILIFTFLFCSSLFAANGSPSSNSALARAKALMPDGLSYRLVRATPTDDSPYCPQGDVVRWITSHANDQQAVLNLLPQGQSSMAGFEKNGQWTVETRPNGNFFKYKVTVTGNKIVYDQQQKTGPATSTIKRTIEVSGNNVKYTNVSSGTFRERVFPGRTIQCDLIRTRARQ
ncbi:MAG: hypothetical protein MJK18_15875 [Bdellovibrionales bacterium]|nr:hypothetical protein [Bdellovibrionales bacterium]